MNEENLKEVHWTDLYTPYNRTPTSFMLMEKGEQVEAYTRLKGVPASRSTNYHVIVTYDEDYVVQWFARKLRCLDGFTWNDVSRLIAKAWKVAKNG